MPQALTYVVSEDFARRTGAWTYNERLLSELASLGWRINRITLPAGFPHPDANTREKTAQLYAEIPDGSIVMTDQVCLSPIADVAAAHGRRLKLVMIVHHPLALEGYPEDDPKRLAANERAALAHARLALVTSRTTADALVADYSVERARVVTAIPGLDRLARSRLEATNRPMLLSVGAVVPRKNHERLISALVPLVDLDWRLVVVGNTTRANAHVASVRAAIDAAGLNDRVTLAGELDDASLEQLWRDADIFVATARHEGYGMAVAEALARGLPVVSTRAGATAGWLDPTAARLIPNDDTAALTHALRTLLTDSAERAKLSAAARAFASTLPEWRVSAAVVDAAFRARL